MALLLVVVASAVLEAVDRYVGIRLLHTVSNPYLNNTLA